MAVTVKPFGILSDGRRVDEITLIDEDGCALSVLSFGARMRSLYLPVEAGTFIDVILGYDSLREYEDDDSYMGAVIGRYANRIHHGKFNINGNTVSVQVNEGDNHLHGGSGFDKKLFTLKETGDFYAELEYTSPDGEAGYPGTVNFSVRFHWQAQCLEISYRAHTDQTTLMNPCAHPYFNLAGHNSGTIDQHRLQIPATCFAPVSHDGIPLGALKNVSNTAFDCREPRTLHEIIASNHKQLQQMQGIDHCYGYSHAPALCPEWRASLSSPDSLCTLKIYSTMPGLQVYGGQHLSTHKGKNGAEYHAGSGLCLEPQFLPDSPNQDIFFTPEINPGEEFFSSTRYCFSTQHKH